MVEGDTVVFLPVGTSDCSGALIYTQIGGHSDVLTASRAVELTLPTAGVYKLCHGAQPMSDADFQYVAGAHLAVRIAPPPPPPPPPQPLQPLDTTALDELNSRVDALSTRLDAFDSLSITVDALSEALACDDDDNGRRLTNSPAQQPDQQQQLPSAHEFVSKYLARHPELTATPTAPEELRAHMEQMSEALFGPPVKALVML